MLAFRLLIKQHERLVGHMVARLVDRREDREELCQDVFVRVYEKINEFNFQSRLSTWIATIAYRQGVDHLRKKKIPLNDIPDEDRYTSQFLSPQDMHEDLEDSDLNEMVMKLITQLPIQYKTVLTLYHLEDRSYPEIVAITGMPEGTVKNYLFRGRHLLKESIKKYLGKEEVI
jgi:RNA polymerase sigma-70 factor (ECF subfamily)